ncbi:MAG TPA: amidohydrolase family protein, partial [Burkholderiaceae bacterium]|nr:amidohydrolase family protein [Burkholderiaceae bacterium]
MDGAVTLPGQGPRLPGLPNLHSHAFQRAFAGLTEHGAPAGDNFWSWRTRMYRFAAGLTPERLRAIATWLYVEMLEAGYTQVCEFHYVHHRADGRPYADDAGYVPYGSLVDYTAGRSNGCTSWSPAASEEILALVADNPTTLYIYPESGDIDAVADAVASRKSLSDAGLYWNAACLSAIGAPRFCFWSI